MDISIQHDQENERFFAVIEGKECVLRYSVSPDQLTLDYYSTYVPQELRGRHIAEYIVKYALDYAQDNQLKVIPSCPFVQRIIDRNPKYNSIVKR